MTQTSAYLPDATIRLLPVRTDILHQHRHHRPERPFQLLAIALKTTVLTEDVNTIENLAKDIHLFLVSRTIADPHRSGIAIPTQMGQFMLTQVTLAANPIHNLQVLTIHIG